MSLYNRASSVLYIHIEKKAHPEPNYGANERVFRRHNSTKRQDETEIYEKDCNVLQSKFSEEF